MDVVWRNLDSESKGVITFEQFTQFMVDRTKDTDSKAEVLDSFKSIANDKVSTALCIPCVGVVLLVGFVQVLWSL